MKCSIDTTSTSDLTERFPLFIVMKSGNQSSLTYDIHLLALHLEQGPFDKIIVVELRLHGVINRRHLLHICQEQRLFSGKGNHLVQGIDKLSQAPLHAISTLIPSPPGKYIFIDIPFVNKDMLPQFRRVIIEQIPQSVDCLSDGGGKERFLLWQILG
jgi:hypothetical protein